MSLFRRGDVWWYEFWFAGRRIQESSKSPSKTIARNANKCVGASWKRASITSPTHAVSESAPSATWQMNSSMAISCASPTRQCLPIMQSTI
jgi:hypothetical protein